jgi:hypothetical protein
MSRTEVKDAWGKVGDELSGLGLKLKLHLEEEFADDDTDEMGSALKRLGDAIENAAEAVGAAVSDKAVHQDVRDAGQLFVKAVSASVEQARAELKPETGEQ